MEVLDIDQFNFYGWQEHWAQSMRVHLTNDMYLRTDLSWISVERTYKTNQFHSSALTC